MIPDESIDFIFSHDSLVAAEADVIEAYLDQLAKKLKPNVVGFIHHSNIKEYRLSPLYSLSQLQPKSVGKQPPQSESKAAGS